MNRKPLFDLTRRLLGRPFRQSEVDDLDAIIDALVDPARLDEPQRRVSPGGIQLIQRFEGCARVRGDGMVEAYPDPGSGGG